MKIIIDIPKKIDEERTFNYFKEKCLDILEELDLFELKIEGTDFKCRRKLGGN